MGWDGHRKSGNNYNTTRLETAYSRASTAVDSPCELAPDPLLAQAQRPDCPDGEQEFSRIARPGMVDNGADWIGVFDTFAWK